MITKSVFLGIPEFCTTPEFQKRMWEAFDRRWHLSAKKRKPETPIGEVMNRVFKATFEKYGIDRDLTLTPSRTELTSRRLNITDAEETSVPSPSCKQLSDLIKSFEDKRLSLKNDSKEKNSNDFYMPQTEQMNVESEPFVCSEAMVGWKDPSECSSSRRSQVGMQFIGKPCFTISCLKDSTKSEITEKILKLNGEVCSNLNSYDPKCTHYLLETPNRGEKFLSCLSAGKWILNLDYINDSYNEDRFLDEEFYEWGNEKNVLCRNLSTDIQQLARAAFYWRDKIMKNSEQCNDNYGAFSGFTVILKMSDKFIQSFKNVITAGKGSVVNVEYPYSSVDLVEVTHCFVDVKKCPLDKNDLAVLKSCDIKIYSHMYINSYLLSPDNADLENFCVK